MDGMDQAKTNIPHFRIPSKSDGEHANFLKVHVTGVLSHGNNIAMCLLDFGRWPQDANVTANALLATLKAIKEQTGRIPPVLYWQMDNCYRDCKNIYILAFCAFLVKARVFRKVRLSYLMVGHTHEDVDQMFSRISLSLRNVNASTLHALRTTIAESYTPTPATVHIENIYDLKEWLVPFIYPLTYHSQPHAFRFKENSMGKVEMTYKLWAGEEKKPWQPIKDGPIIVLDRLPPGTPSVLKPENEQKNCPDPDTMVTRLKHLSQRMNSEEIKWWEEFVTSERHKRAVWEAMTEVDYQEAGKSFSVASLRCTDYTSEGESDDEDLQKKRE